MVLVNEQYKVTIHTEYMPPVETYTVLYQPKDLDMVGVYSARLIEVETQGEQTYRFALLDLVISGAEPCAVLEKDSLTVIFFSKILRIDLRTKAVALCVDCENMGGLEQIHSIEGGYLVKGEGDIFRYDNALKRIWDFTGRDIFATSEGDECFWIDGGVIHCRDWEGWQYILDMNGNVISETLEKTPEC